MLESSEKPAIVLSKDYRILAVNESSRSVLVEAGGQQDQGQCQLALLEIGEHRLAEIRL